MTITDSNGSFLLHKDEGCGNKNIPALTSHTNEVSLAFSSDYIYNYKGFALLWFPVV